MSSSERSADARASAAPLIPSCRGATPDLQDASGNTALHLLVVRIAKEKIFPDLEPEMAFNVRPTAAAAAEFAAFAHQPSFVSSTAAPGAGLEAWGGALSSAPWDSSAKESAVSAVHRATRAPCCARHAAQIYDQDLMYRDDDRIEFLEGVGSALVRAGWSLDLPNGKGRTVRRLLQLSHHIAEVGRGCAGGAGGQRRRPALPGAGGRRQAPEPAAPCTLRDAATCACDPSVHC